VKYIDDPEIDWTQIMCACIVKRRTPSHDAISIGSLITTDMSAAVYMAHAS
jgi:hypothetical protein